MSNSIRTWLTKSVKVLVTIAFLVSAFALAGGSASAKGESRAVYTLTNAAASNAVAVFNRASDGTLTPSGTVPTGGLGTGAGLGSQGALALSDNGRWLFAVNAGSNDVSVLNTSGYNLTLVDRVPSGGVRPISLTVNGDVLYVLNAGTPNNITGFKIGHLGTLSQIPGSTRPLSGADVGPAQVEFSDNGRLLVVTEKGTNKIDTYTVSRSGLATGPNVQNSAGMTPFGFEFDKRDHLIVSEAFGGAANASAASSYSLNNAGVLTTISASSPTHQTAACWVAISKDGKYAYTTNAGSGSVTGYRIGHDGSLTLLDPDGVTALIGAGSSPIDATVSNDGRFLYVLTAGSHEIAGFEIEQDGSLTPTGNVGGLLPGTIGLAAR
ncbi:MAG: beta-propeller fold lactonase family protein [Chloroflexia bacterium]